MNMKQIITYCLDTAKNDYKFLQDLPSKCFYGGKKGKDLKLAYCRGRIEALQELFGK